MIYRENDSQLIKIELYTMYAGNVIIETPAMMSDKKLTSVKERKNAANELKKCKPRNALAV